MLVRQDEGMWQKVDNLGGTLDHGYRFIEKPAQGSFFFISEKKQYAGVRQADQVFRR